MRSLGVDYGKSRTGLALSDAAGVTCRPLAILKEREEHDLVMAIVAAAGENDAERIVVGMPRPLSGGTNQQMKDVLSFVDSLRNVSSLPVETWDERFTSRLAEKGRKTAEPRDSVAACYMLQNYLDRLAAEGRG